MKQPLCYHGHPYPMIVAPWEQPDDDLSDEFEGARESADRADDIEDRDPTELW